MLFDGKPMMLSAPSEALALGIAMVFQETMLVPSMTVAQNIYLGDEKLFNRLRGLYNQAQQFLAGMNFQVNPTALVSSLCAAHKQMVEIAAPFITGAHHHLRRADRLATPGEKSLLRPGAAPGETGRRRDLHQCALEEALMLADRITVLRRRAGGDGAGHNSIASG
jgi:simple sugar transport system ATP-binding protein/ribose transport system ATP-binding protein